MRPHKKTVEIKRQDTWIPTHRKHLIAENEKYWREDIEITRDDKWICVFHMRGIFEYALCEDVVAKGLQKREGLPVMSILDGDFSKCFDDLDASFGIKERYQLPLRRYAGIISRIRTFLFAKYFALTTYKKKDRLLALRYRGIPCGNAIWDEIIRYDADGNYYTLDKYEFDCFGIDRETYFKYLRSALSIIDRSYQIFRKKKPAYFVATEAVFLKSLCGGVARHMGATMLMTDGHHGRCGFQVLPQTELFRTDQHRVKIERYLKRNPLNEYDMSSMEDLFVIKNKKELGDIAFQETGGKKNVFIMLHGLADAPREACRHTVYNDYAEWFIDTIRIIKTIPDVNWIIKDHPFSCSHRQTKYVREVFEKNKTENMYWCDKDVDGMQIKEIADCIVTCSGEVGLEYWAYGIPTISVSQGYYVPWGISYNMKTLREYEDTLKNVGDLKKPPEESMKMARKYLIALKNLGKVDDALGKLFQKIFAGKASTILRYADTDIFPIEYSFCKEYIALLKGDHVKQSTIYQLSDLIELS